MNRTRTNETEISFLQVIFLFGSALRCLHSTANCTPTKKGQKIWSREEGKDYSFSHHANLTVLIWPQDQLPSLGRSSFLASHLAAQLTTGLPAKLFSPVSESNASPPSECYPKMSLPPKHTGENECFINDSTCN